MSIERDAPPWLVLCLGLELILLGTAEAMGCPDSSFLRPWRHRHVEICFAALHPMCDRQWWWEENCNGKTPCRGQGRAVEQGV